MCPGPEPQKFKFEYSANAGIPPTETCEPSTTQLYTDTWCREFPIAVPDAVQVTTMVFVVSVPELARKLQRDGKLLYCGLGDEFPTFPLYGSSVPFGERVGNFVQNLIWMIRGWRCIERDGPAISSTQEQQEPKTICFTHQETGAAHPC